MLTYDYHLAHLEHVTTPDMGTHYRAPAGVVGFVDLRTLPEQSVGGVAETPVLCWCEPGTAIPSLVKLGTGDIRNLEVAAVPGREWKRRLGKDAMGRTLADNLTNHLLDGDPIGKRSCKPVVPADGVLRFPLLGHGDIRAERFQWGIHPHTANLTSLLRADFSSDLQFDRDQRGAAKADKAAAKRLGALVLKYGLNPRDITDKIEPGQPGTRWTDSFNVGNNSALSGDLTWTEYDSLWATDTNQAYYLGPTVSNRTARANSDVSSSDHIAYVTVATLNASTTAAQGGACVRFSASANTCYSALYGRFVAAPTNRFLLIKYIADALTVIVGPVAITFTLSEICKAVVEGSALVGYANGVLTGAIIDTAISSGTRGGVYAFGSASGDYARLDSYVLDDRIVSAADLRYGVVVGSVTGTLQMPNSGTPTGTQDATSDACVVSGKTYGSPERTGSAATGINRPQARHLGM